MTGGIAVRTVRISLFLFYFFSTLSCSGIDEKALLSFLNQYRLVKSLEVARTGSNVTPAIKENWATSFYAIADSNVARIFILKNDYQIKSVKKVHEIVDTDQNGNVYGDSYHVRIIEEVIGEVKDGKSVFFPDANPHEELYAFILTSNGFKVNSEYTLNNLYVVEKDLQILLNRLSSSR